MYGRIAEEIESLVLGLVDAGATLFEIGEWFHDTYLDDRQAVHVTDDRCVDWDGEDWGRLVCIAVAWANELVEPLG